MGGWLEAVEDKEPELTADLLDRLRKIGICFCTTEYGCVACGGQNGDGMSPRNVFENHKKEETEPEKSTVPLRLGVGGPVIGTAKVDKDGVSIGEITDPAVKQALAFPGGSFSLQDPAGRYKYVDPERVDLTDYTEEWYRQNPDAPRPDGDQPNL